jgi:hypothetical protein
MTLPLVQKLLTGMYLNKKLVKEQDRQQPSLRKKKNLMVMTMVVGAPQRSPRELMLLLRHPLSMLSQQLKLLLLDLPLP